MNTSPPTTSSPSSGASTAPRNPIAHGEVMSELTRLAISPLATQARDSRLEITIDGVPTYWRRPLSAVVPAFLTFSRGPRAFLQLWHPKENTLLQFVRSSEARWAFDRRVSEPAAVVQALPFSAIVRPEGEARASTAQLDALRRMLQLPSNHALPSLHSFAATRLLNRLLLEPALVRLRAEHMDQCRAPAQPLGMPPTCGAERC